MLAIKKLVLRLTMIGSISLLAHNRTAAKNKPISLQEALDIALKGNFNIQIAENIKKQNILSNKKKNFSIWAPRATFMVYQDNIWRSIATPTAQKNSLERTVFRVRSVPIFKLEWELGSLFNKIFDTKIHAQDNFIHKLVAKKTVEKELQQVVTAYYALALAQKKWELSNNLIKLATARLKIEEAKLRLGLISKIDFLDAQLAVKQVKLALLVRKQNLTAQRRRLNLVLGKPLAEETLVQSNISVQPIWDIKRVSKEKVFDLDKAIQEKKVAIASTHLSKAKTYLLSCLSLYGSFHSNGYIYDLQKQKLDIDDKRHEWMGSIGVTIDIATLLLIPAKVKKAKIEFNNASYALKQRKLTLESDLEDKKWQYLHALDTYKVTEEQLKISKQKLAFIREKYRLKQVKLLELHEAEEATQKAEITLVEHAFKVKQAEFELYRVVGMFHRK